MRRRPRHISPTEIYHFGSRGSNAGPVYFDELDYAIWRRELARVARRYDWTVYAWTQMPNHFHVLARTEHGALSAGMQDLNWRYSRRTNVRHERRAHLFENRFWSEAVADTEQLMTALSYVDMNPYKSRRRCLPEEWPHGSFRAVAGYEHPPSFLAIGQVLGLFNHDPATAVSLYREFAKTGMARVDKSRSQATLTSVPREIAAATRG